MFYVDHWFFQLGPFLRLFKPEYLCTSTSTIEQLQTLSNLKQLQAWGLELDIHGIGRIHGDIGKMIVALLAQVAEMERSKIRERTAAGRAAAKASFEATGKTHKGKFLLGRPKAANQAQVKAWRELNSASISQTAKQFKISEATVKNYCRL